MPSSACSPSPKGHDQRASLEVVHKHGPCSKLRPHKANSPSHTQILAQDESRVASIQSRLAKNLAGGSNLKASKATLPSKSASTLGSGNYVVTVGLGSPKRDLTFIFDTGSDLTWTQCEPCVGYCYQQREHIFDPSTSLSYSNVSCDSPSCEKLESATGNSPGCSSSTCLYGIRYGDGSYSIGFFAREKLSLTSTDVFNNFQFGCGQNNRGLFGGTAGLLGLARNPLSLVSQTAQKYGKVFSYCLPSSSSSTGYLSFGSGDGDSKAVKFTPRLPPTVYSSVQKVFRELMSDYPRVKGVSILDTCYDLSKYKTVKVPKIILYFSGGAEMDLAPEGIIYVLKVSQVCLAFAGNSDDDEVAIIGNVQQKTIHVVYDDAEGRVGFAPSGCN
ncbi:unnamed protein product, partial [Vitis vinifera]